MVDYYSLKIASEKVELIQETLNAIDEVVALISVFTGAEENKTLLSKLLENIGEVKQIIGSADLMETTTEDINKGTYLGNRKLDLDIAINKTGIDETTTYEEALGIWNTTSNTVYYNKATCTFVDGTVIVVDFVNDDAQAIQVSTHGAIVDQLSSHAAFTAKLENTSIVEEVGGKTGTIIRVVDVTGKSSNVERIQLHATTGAYVNAEPIYFWALSTSALQTLANRVGDIIALGNNIDDVIVLSSSIDEMLELQNALTQLLEIHANLTEILAAKTHAQNALQSAQSATQKVLDAQAQVQLAKDQATLAKNEKDATVLKAQEAAQSATIATNKANEIKNVSVASTTTAVPGTPAKVTYNPATGKFDFIVPQGDKGEKGDAFQVNAVGTLAQRALYDAQLKNFSYLATDVVVDGEVVPSIFFKLSATAGDWSAGSPFGKGDKGDHGIGIGAIDFTSTTDVSGQPSQSGAIDTYTITFTDTTTTEFSVYNGKDADLSGYYTKTETDALLSTTVLTAKIATPSASAISSTNMVLNSAIDSFGVTDKEALRVAFEYRAVGAGVWLSTSTVEKNTLGSFSASITGLSITTQYEFRAKATDVLNPTILVYSDVSVATTTSNAIPTDPTNTATFATTLAKGSTTPFTFAGASDSDGTVTHYLVTAITSPSLSVAQSEVAVGSAHSFVVSSSLSADETVSFTVKAKDNAGGYSNGVVITLTLKNAYVATPSLSVTGTPSAVIETPTLTSGAFSAVGATDTHASTDWIVLKTADNSVVWQSLNNTVNKLSITVPSGLLKVATAYEFKMRHNGTTYGSSNYVSVSGTTKSAFTIPIGTAGAVGFGVAPSSEAFTVLGLSDMTGTNDVNSDNYGNYQHTNGSIMVHVPKFYYRIGNASAPQYATYGANSVEIAGTDTFADESAANAAGYALHRAFIDGGAVKGGFFIDKYMASKKTGDTNVAVSVKNGNPIGLTTNATYTPSSTMTGCTGILADAVTLSRARGSYFNTASVFMYGALALLSVAHGQKATSTTGCEWYDASRTMNFPKGCNNGSRADVNDTSVTWSASPDTAAKGLTGSASTFAKSTHNGQNNGIADLNGLMYEVALGMTNIGTSATDTAQISSNLIYLLKQSVALKSLTAGWDGTLDAWGNSTHLATLYDQVTSPIELSVAGSSYWGSGNNAVFSSALSGVGRDMCGFLPKDNNAYDATGTNMCGGDYIYRYNRSNMFPYVSGYWGGAAYVGVFCRYLAYYRSNDRNDAGFRVSAYV